MHVFPFWNYARALFELSDDPSYAAIEKSLAFIEKLLEQHGELREFIDNPHIRHEKKIELIAKLAHGHVDPMSLQLLYVVVDKKKTEHFKDITNCFRELVHEKRNELCAEVLSAHELSGEQVKRIKRDLEKIHFGKTILMKTKVAPEFIGGMRISINDRRYDYSIAGYLKKLKNELV